MRKLLVAIVVVGLCVGSSACKHTSAYQSWGEQLGNLPLHNGRVEDVSMMLGSPPSRCEPIENPQPIIGVRYDTTRQQQPIIINVQPDSPAYQAGIRPGDIIKSVGGQPVTTPEQAHSTLSNSLRAGQAINIETNRGVVSVVPSIPKVEQCYWEVQAGRVAKTGSYAAVNKYGGSSASGGSGYERFFRASCRIHNGFVSVCKANWQE